MKKRYRVYYVTRTSYLLNTILDTDSLNDAIDCYCTFIFDNKLSDIIDYCDLVDLSLDNHYNRILHTKFRLV